jgi:hypothetical protein
MLQACFNSRTKGFQLKHRHILRLYCPLIVAIRIESEKQVGTSEVWIRERALFAFST